MRALFILPLLLAGFAASPAAADEAPACTTASAKPSSVAAIIAGEAVPGDCVTLTAIGWKGALYDNVAQIYAEPRRARDPKGGGNRVAFYPPHRFDEDAVVMLGGPDFAAEALQGFEVQPRYVTATGKLSMCRYGATKAPRPTPPFAVDEDACNGRGGVRFSAVAAAVDTARPVERLTSVDADAPARLVPLAADSPWLPRFAAAADALLPALRSRDEAQWVPLLGGQWLPGADRAQVAAMLSDRKSPFQHALFAKGATHRTILGWPRPVSFTSDDIAAIDARPEAEALVCWSSEGAAETLWPRAAFDADNRPGRPYACARIAYSVRDGKPSWRAFIEEGAGGLAEPAI